MPLCTDVIKRRKAIEPSCPKLLGGHPAVPILIHNLQYGVDDMIRLFLVFDFVLEDVRWMGIRERGGLPWIAFGSKRGERRKWPLFLRGPIPHLCMPDRIQQRTRRRRAQVLPVQVVQLEEALEVKRISKNPGVHVLSTAFSYTPRKRKWRLNTHMWCSEAICEWGNEDVGSCVPEIGMGTYVTDGIVSTSELRVLASVVVTVSGDQDCEKEGYCREGLHGVAVWEAVRQPSSY